MFENSRRIMHKELSLISFFSYKLLPPYNSILSVHEILNVYEIKKKE